MEEAIVNRVVTSGLITFDLAEYYHRGERIIYDLKDNLFMGMILKEK
ncbi:MAG: aryl-alcohol dehydrogenase-like predicted oxidoreductase, partial [Oceanospirillaceae bacterium]